MMKKGTARTTKKPKPKSVTKRMVHSAAPLRLFELASGKWVSQALAAAVELGIAERLAKGSRSTAELARAAGATEDGVYRLLRALASVGVCTESAHRRFRLTALGRELRPEAHGGYARFLGHEITWRPWGELVHSVRTGAPAFDRVFGMPAFDYLAQNPDSAAIFDAAMTSISAAESRAVVEAYDFSPIHTLVDVGGGRGLLIARILRAARRVQGILFDMPHVVAGAADLLAAQGVADRCQVMPGDFFAFVPDGGDAYVLKHVLHDWDDGRALRILKNCRHSMGAGSRLLVIDPVIPPGNAPHWGKLLDLEMLVMTPYGRERTREEFRTLFRRAGLRLRRVVPTSSPVSILEVVRD
jgi:O-methyltransferase domain/Dimerisation domain